MLALVSAATVGAVLATRRPRHPVGWLLLALGLSLMAGGLGGAYTDYGLLARPGALPATHVVARHWTATTVIALQVSSLKERGRSIPTRKIVLVLCAVPP
jgi:hypothetical protein